MELAERDPSLGESCLKELSREALHAWQGTRNHLVEHHAEAKDVASSVDGLSEDLFWGRIGRCPQVATDARQPTSGVEIFGDSEVQNFDSVVCIANHDIRGLQIAMDDAMGMGAPHSSGDVACKGESANRGEGSILSKDIKERTAFDVLANDVELLLYATQAEDAHEIWMAHTPEFLALAQKALAYVRAVLECGAEKLDCEVAIAFVVSAAPDVA
jgi:hypothetical protein